MRRNIEQEHEKRDEHEKGRIYGKRAADEGIDKLPENVNKIAMDLDMTDKGRCKNVHIYFYDLISVNNDYLTQT